MRKATVRIKRPFWVVGLNVALVLTIGSTQAFADPIPISTVAELLDVSGDFDYILTGNLDLSTGDADDSTPEIESADLVTIDSPTGYINAFAGTFDGGNYTISGLTKPLFENIGGDGSTEISNLTLAADTGGLTGRGILANDAYMFTYIENVHGIGNINGGASDSVGGLVGIQGLSGEIRSSTFAGNVESTSYNFYGITGGLVGTTYSSIVDSSTSGTVEGIRNVGGLVGQLEAGAEISNSNSTSTVGAIASGVGGLIGLNSGDISNSYATGTVFGNNGVGGLVGENYGDIEKSFSNSTVIGLGESNNDIGGLVGYNSGEILGSYAISNVTGENEVGGLVGENYGFVTNSYTAGYVTGDTNVGGLIGLNGGNIANSYTEATVYGDNIFGGLIGNHGSGLVTYSFSVNNDGFGEFNRTAYSDQCAEEEFGVGVECGENISPFPSMLQVINTGLEDTFAYDNCINSGIPYLVPLINSYSNGCEDITLKTNSYSLSTQVLDVLSKSVGFKLTKIDLSKFDLAFLDQVTSNKSAQIIGSKLFANQSLSTSLSVGNLLQLEINFEANKSLQMWVKGSDNQYVLLGNITFDKDGKAMLPGIEFKKSGLYELIFVNSDKKDLTQPELVNKVSGVTVYVN
jgi:hypothetical protein